MTRVRISEEARAELYDLAARNGGLLKPDAVLEQARQPNSALHPLFTWDNAQAAELRRLDEARRVIMAVRVQIMPQADAPPIRVRAFVSLSEDRVSGAGYRPITVVLNDPSQRAQLLRTAIQEFAALRKKYERLSELVQLFEQVDAAAAKSA